MQEQRRYRDEPLKLGNADASRCQNLELPHHQQRPLHACVYSYSLCQRHLYLLKHIYIRSGEAFFSQYTQWQKSNNPQSLRVDKFYTAVVSYPAVLLPSTHMSSHLPIVCTLPPEVRPIVSFPPSHVLSHNSRSTKN